MVYMKHFLIKDSILNIKSLDAWPMDKRLKHIIQHISVDEWKAKPEEQVMIKESKLEKLELLVRILKNTTGINAHYPKNLLVSG
jgi:hypothetical protein